MSRKHDDSEAEIATVNCPDCGRTVSNEDDATESTVHCPDCETSFRLLLVPVERSMSGDCPACGGDLAMGDFGDPLTCNSCGRAWEIQERSWLETVDP